MLARRHFVALTAIAAIFLALLAVPASADAIDGDWCSDDRRHFTIRGPAITTPGGARIEGNYGRHSFSYVVPDGEQPTGENVTMILVNDNTIELMVGEGGQTETWLRCKAAIS